MFLMLVTCGALYFILGDKNEGIMLLSSVFIIIGITFYQERKTERALEALRDLSSPRALVIRDGVQTRVAGREVVTDDIFVVSEGDRIPADGIVLSVANISVDESLLTGESIPVQKTAWNGISSQQRAGGGGTSSVFSGTLVVQGKAICRAVATGQRTEMGKIGKTLERIQHEQTLLQKEVVPIVRTFAIAGSGLSLLVFFLYSIHSGNWLEGLLAGISLEISMLPEEFPVVLTIFLALGAWRISRKGVLTRRVAAVEMLGAATVLCTDKTGTVTLNQMTVRELVVDSAHFVVEDQRQQQLPEQFHRILEYGILASHRDPFDPMEKAFVRLGDRFLAGTEHLHDEWTLVREYPLSPDLLAMSEVWEAPDHSAYVIASKGAPEAIIDLCHLDEQAAEAIMAEVLRLARKGMRVLAVASSRFTHASLPNIQHDFTFEFLGLLGLEDPVRPTVPDSVQECYDAGIRVVMITGDYSETAIAVAGMAGIRDAQSILTGQELDELTEDALRERIRTVNVFARIAPEQKLRIVEALKANGEIVAMTGDGVNDAPALKAAHIGISMGQRGSDVAREASDLVLLEDDFSSIVSAIRMGRRIVDNLQKAMSYIAAIHVPIAGLALVPVLLKMPLVLYPVHIMFLELIIDPACSIIFEVESEERDIMNRPPRSAKSPLFGTGRLLISLMQGASVLCVLIILYGVSLGAGKTVEQARTLTFVTFIIANIGLILTNRTWSRTMIENFGSFNRAAVWIIGGALSFLALAIYTPFLRSVFQFAPLSVGEIVICTLTGFFGILWFEALKVLMRKKVSSVRHS